MILGTNNSLETCLIEGYTIAIFNTNQPFTDTTKVEVVSFDENSKRELIKTISYHTIKELEKRILVYESEININKGLSYDYFIDLVNILENYENIKTK